MTKHKEVFLSINGLQSVRYEGSYSKKHQYFLFLVVLLTNLFVLMINLVSQLFFTEVKMLLINLLKQLKSMNTLKEYEYCKRVGKKYFNKNLIIATEEEQQLQSSNTCWICKNIIESEDEKVRDHYHITGKFRGAAHWSCNIYLQLTKKVPVIFHNLRGYDGNLIFYKLKNLI